MTPSARSAALLRAEGFLVDATEKRLPRCFISVDLYHAFDLVGIRIDRLGVLGVQVTTTSNQSKRLYKLLGNEAVRVWLMAGNAVELHGWKKSARTGRWEVTRRPITLADLVPAVAQALDSNGKAAGSDCAGTPSRS